MVFGSRNKFEAHFLNVGKGDCIVMQHPGDEDDPKGRVSIVDINVWRHRQDPDVAGLGYFLRKTFGSGSPESEAEYADQYLTDPIKFIQRHVDADGGVWRFICSHPDMDHLSGIKQLDDQIGFTEFWDTFHEKTLSSDQSQWTKEFDQSDWNRYEQIRHSETDHHNISPMKGLKTSTWRDDDIDILHPSSAYVQQVNRENANRSNQQYNHLSYVLKVNTAAGGILLPGDLDDEGAWERVLSYAEDDLNDVRVLKAAHHGHESGFYEPAIKAMDPDYVILSVGKKKDHDAQQKYRRVCGPETEVYSTRQHGRISIEVTEAGEMSVELEEPDGIFDLPA